MGKKVIMTGATGMVGKGVLLECLDHSEIEEVLVIGRNTVGMDHPKLIEILHADFSDFSPIRDRLGKYDACFFCLGISSAGMNEESYRTITHDFTMALAGILYEMNPELTFNYVSGMGTDSTEKGRVMWARVKGGTENDLIKMGFRQAYMFRPGIILPRRGVKSGTRLYRLFYTYFLWLLKFVKILAPNSIVDTTQFGLAMINTVSRGYKKNILDPKDILLLSENPE